jgi:hypothetical protein
VSGTTVTALLAGMCTITASQGGNATFRAAPDVAHSLEIQAGAQPQKIAFGPLPAVTVGALVPLAATTTSGLTVAFRSGTPALCALAGTTVTTLAPGMCTITATQGGSALYTAAPEVTQSFQVPAGKVAQTITFAQPKGARIGAAAALLATATRAARLVPARARQRVRSQGRPSSPAAGACTITASQEAAPATGGQDIARTFPVRAGRQPQTTRWPPPEALAWCRHPVARRLPACPCLSVGSPRCARCRGQW